MQPHGACAYFGAMLADEAPKPGVTKSPVWAHFGFKANESSKPIDESQPKCKECHGTVATKGGNFSNRGR